MQLRSVGKWVAAEGLLPAMMQALMLACLLALLAPSAARASDDAAWLALKSGRHVVLLRHAVTEAGIGDPPNFKKDDCSTQRNLSAQGRSDAKKIGDAFRQHNIPVADVWSSRWCRCIDTARIAFGRVKPLAMLDSMFNDPEGDDEQKLRALREALKNRPRDGNLVLVTHAFNISKLTGVSPASGEMLVVAPQKDGSLKLIARLDPARN